MAKTAIVSEELAKKFASEKISPLGAGGGSTSSGALRAEPAYRRAQAMGAARRHGVFINHEASRTSNDCYVCEIPPAGKLAPQRQLFEEMILVLDGRGSTTVWNDAGARITFEWKAGALFAIPLNTWHQHFNGSGRVPARYVAVTNAPR
jgi:mannose-6-phosphate isomerase-like protein (cupin superfamily)